MSSLFHVFAKKYIKKKKDCILARFCIRRVLGPQSSRQNQAFVLCRPLVLDREFRPALGTARKEWPFPAFVFTTSCEPVHGSFWKVQSQEMPGYLLILGNRLPHRLFVRKDCVLPIASSPFCLIDMGMSVGIS